MTKLVYLVGKTGSGKSTTAQKLQDALAKRGIPSKILSFAEPLKELTHKVFGHNDPSLKDLPVAQTVDSTDRLVHELEEFIVSMGEPADQLYWQVLLPLLNQRVLSPRMLMNAAGYAARGIDNMIFVKAADRKALEFIKQRGEQSVVIFDDARFYEEVSEQGEVVVLDSAERGIIQNIDHLYIHYIENKLDFELDFELEFEHTVLDVSTHEAADKSIQAYVEKLLSN
jgi:ABC-type dipeptide/oligopeptide/nickel transport system ATPase component